MHTWSLTKTGANPTGQPSSNRHNGAFLAPSRRDPVENLFEYPVARQRAPGGFDEQMADTTEPWRLIWPRRTEAPDEYAGCQPV